MVFRNKTHLHVLKISTNAQPATVAVVPTNVSTLQVHTNVDVQPATNSTTIKELVLVGTQF